MADTYQLKGFVNAHSHAFQRALRGRTEGADFWAWRETMLDLARGQTPGRVREEYEAVYREMLGAGYTAVGEFHYLGTAEAHAAAEAAAAAGIELVLLYVAYGRGGIDRFRQDSVADYLRGLEQLRAAGIRVGVTPHSVRACPRDWLEDLGRYAAEHALPLHVHADEQPREIEECLAEHGLRPIELLAAAGCLGPRTTIVHATHADGRELDLLAEAGARICACPTTEANLGDGFLPVERVLHRSIPVCIGSDANVRIDPFEELRELDGIARRQAGRRDVLTVDALLSIGSDEGAAALGLDDWPAIEIDAVAPAAARRRRSARRARRLVLGRRRPLEDSVEQRPGGLRVLVGEAARLGAVDLHQPPELTALHEREHQQRAVAELAQHRGLGAVHVDVVQRERARLAVGENADRLGIVGDEVPLAELDRPAALRVLDDEDEHVADRPRDAAGVRVERLGELTRGSGEDVEQSQLRSTFHREQYRQTRPGAAAPFGY